ncbi:MAG: hypothetical protein ACYCY7_12880 [Gallionella sp.]
MSTQWEFDTTTRSLNSLPENDVNAEHPNRPFPLQALDFKLAPA